MLSPDDKAILRFERGWWLEAGPKDQAVEHTLGLSSALYYERLLHLISTSEALAYDPLTVRRVRALIEPVADRELAV